MTRHALSTVSFETILHTHISSSQTTSLVFESLPTTSSKAWLIAKLYSETGKNILVVTAEGLDETKLKDDIAFFVQEPIYELPSLETFSSETASFSKESTGIRQKTLQAIVKRKELHCSAKRNEEEKLSSSPLIVISSLQATLQKFPSLELLHSGRLDIQVTDSYSYQEIIDTIHQLGYERTAVTTERGEYSVRGGIIDIFPVTSDMPSRIELYEDQIDSIRFFDPLSQKTVQETASIEIIRAREDISKNSVNIDEKDTQSIFDLMGDEATIVILDDVETIEDRYAMLRGGEVSVSSYKKEDIRLVKTSSSLLSLSSWLHKIQQSSSWCMMTTKTIEELSHDIQYHHDPKKEGISKKSLSSKRYQYGNIDTISFHLFEKTWKACRLCHPLQSFEMFYMDECLYDVPFLEGEEALLDAYVQTHNTVRHTFLIQSDLERQWLQTKLMQRGIGIDSLAIQMGYLSCGFCRSDTKEVYLPVGDLTGRKAKNRRRMSGHQLSSTHSIASGSTSRNLSPATGFDAYELQAGNSVVHFHHGIGKFLGIQVQPNAQGVDQEFFLIEYAENSKLYVPLSQAHLITKYIGSRDDVPKLHTLGTSKWKKLREETERAIVGYASELLKSHAKRQIQGGFAYPNDGAKMLSFEAEFPYQETEDQLKAIEAIKNDMISAKAMDRLVCGDVGYGKTEVAMRAAFKAVVDGKKQVAVLVPTTVLAMQHYENFVERMASFEVRIGILSRFQTMKQNRQTTEKIALGEIDIVIGTHKLLQKDLVFCNLGLVIIDEEQRFGVRAKEHLKIMKEGVDCLSLSATPIPRTLYMSLAGAKELSTISTPPYDRLAVKTIVAEYEPSLIQAAILREVNRGGQVFYIYNRVQTIFDICDKIKKLVPKAKITAVHGQMDSDEIDVIFHAFKRGDIDILVATSIIENGIDIPNANTIIVERADQFGVAELYQLRGRVGRSNKRAFAYFLIPSKYVLSEIARRRIDAIAQSGGFGGGLKVAMRDLEIRGAGDMLGVEQSGHVATIGFHLYCKLLKKTVDSLQGKKTGLIYDTKIETSFIAKLPDWYVNEVSLRVEIYQRLGETSSVDYVDEIAKELVDRFGALPKEAEWLIAIAKVRALASLKGVTLLKLENVSVIIERKNGAQIAKQHFLLPQKVQYPDDFTRLVSPLL